MIDFVVGCAYNFQVSSLSDWYDVPVRPIQDPSLSISYTCESGSSEQFLTLDITGENTKPPTFKTTGEYAGTISKGMTLGVALDCLPDTNFHMVVVDTDFIDPDNAHCLHHCSDEGSSNEVTCQADPDEFFDCQAVGSLGEYEIHLRDQYEIHLVLKKSLATITDETYTFTVVAQVRPDRHKLSMYSYSFELRTKEILFFKVILQR